MKRKLLTVSIILAMTVPSAAFAGQAPRGMKMKPSDFMTESSKRTPEQKKEIQELNLGEMTPIEGLNYLFKLQNQLKNRW